MDKHHSIHQAAEYGNTEIIREYFRQDHDSVNIQDELGWTPMHWSAFYGRAEAVRLLLFFGADPDVRDNYGQTPLHLAVKESREEVATVLIRHRARLDIKDSYGLTPLTLAEKEGRREILEIMKHI